MPRYIRGIGIQNFKTYSKYQFCNFSNISFLIGKNGVGKSSFLQAAQLVFKFLEKANLKWDEIVDNEFEIIEIDKVIGDEFFDNYYDFTSISQIINDFSKPLIIDLVLDFGYDAASFLICPLKYQFIFSIHDKEGDLSLILDEFNIEDFEQKQRILTNSLKNWNEPYNIKFTSEGLVFLLSSFLDYINKADLPAAGTILEKLVGKSDRNSQKNSLKSKYGVFEKEFLYGIDDTTIYQALQQYGIEHGFVPNESIVSKVKIFIGGIESYLNTDNLQLKEVLNISYQAIKESFLIIAKKISGLEAIKISEITSRKRTLNKDDVFLRCFNDETKLNSDFIGNNLDKFDFKGVPTIEQISKDDKKFKIVLFNKSNDKINLIDEGSGYWTLTYLIFILGNEINKNKIIIIEEPETYLHPNFQANLADLFIEAVARFGHQLIIETHSEYLIKRLQRRVSQTNNRDKLKSAVFQDQEPIPFDIFPGDISINYINDLSVSNDIINISIDESGDLDRPFPSDFMDVSINEDLLSFKLKNVN